MRTSAGGRNICRRNWGSCEDGHDVRDKAQERHLCGGRHRTYHTVVTLPSDHIAQLLDRCFNFRQEKHDAEFASGSDRGGERVGYVFEDTYAEPGSSEIKRDPEIVKRCPDVGGLVNQASPATMRIPGSK